MLINLYKNEELKKLEENTTGMIDPTELEEKGTGFIDSNEYLIVEYPFGKYTVKVKLSLKQEFIGILEIKINKEFIDFKQKMTSQGYHDVDEFYPE